MGPGQESVKKEHDSMFGDEEEVPPEQKEDFEQQLENMDGQLENMEGKLKSAGSNPKQMLQQALNVEKEDEVVGREMHSIIANAEKAEEVNQEVSMAHIE